MKTRTASVRGVNVMEYVIVLGVVALVVVGLVRGLGDVVVAKYRGETDGVASVAQTDQAAAASAQKAADARDRKNADVAELAAAPAARAPRAQGGTVAAKSSGGGPIDLGPPSSGVGADAAPGSAFDGALATFDLLATSVTKLLATGAADVAHGARDLWALVRGLFTSGAS